MKPARHALDSVHDTCAMPTPDVHAFVRASLPPPPARVLEVGAGGGELATELRAARYDVLAIDPAGGSGVRQVPLHLVDGPGGSFDAAVAVVSLHHVEPLEESCRRLGELVAAGGRLVVDEFGVFARFGGEVAV
jgi:SAM-dependent methyltransferase